MTRAASLLAALIVALTATAHADPTAADSPKAPMIPPATLDGDPVADIDTAGFERETVAALALRETRTVSTKRFLELMQRDDVVLLDTRSKWAYDAKHIAGAVHLNFSDFSKDSLAKVIPSKDTLVLIYCNNNLEEPEPMAFARKWAPMALNIPTFVNLYGYGYRNVYELGTLLRVGDPRLPLEGTHTGPAIQVY